MLIQRRQVLERYKTYLEHKIHVGIDFDLETHFAQNRSLLSRLELIQSNFGILDKTELDDKSARVDFERNCYKDIALSKNIFSKTEEQTSVSNSRSIRSSIYNTIRLPEIYLPKFSGKYESCFPNHDTFFSLIHENQEISDMQKFLI